METSWLVRLLQDVTAKVEIQRVGDNYEDNELARMSQKVRLLLQEEEVCRLRVPLRFLFLS